MHTKYSIAAAFLDENDSRVVDLWAQGLEGLVGEVAVKKFRQFYLENPAGLGDCVLLLASPSAHAVGVQGFVPRRFWRGARNLNAAVMADFVVVPGHRSLGPALKLTRAGIELGKNRYDFFYGTPNQKSLGVVRRAGMISIGSFTRYTKVVRSEAYWRRRLPNWLVLPIAVVADVVIAGADLSHVLLRAQSFSWVESDGFGPEIDRIWERRPSRRIYGERSRATMTWRYPPSDSKGSWQVSVATDRDGLSVGFIVWRTRNRAAMISDVFFLGSDSAMQTFFRSFSWYVRQFEVDRVSLEFFGGKGVVDALLGSGFASREQSPIVAFAPPGGAFPFATDDAYMTSFDRDNEE